MSQISKGMVLMYISLILLVTVQARVDRKVASVDGDIIIGALFPIHRRPTTQSVYTRQCGEIWEQYGIHRTEVFFRTLESINKNQNILPNVTLGCDIRDSCWYAPVALEQSIDFIKNSIAIVEDNNTTDETVGCSKTTAIKKPIAGLIGPGSSQVTIQIQNLLQLFRIPQIGYSATSKDLSDKSLYKFFMRVVPPDTMQAQALLDIAVVHNWTYVSTVFTDGNYGASGMEAFNNLAHEANVCISTAVSNVPNNAANKVYDDVIKKLQKTPQAHAVICFCEGMTIRRLLMATRRLNATGQFVFVGSDGWAVRSDVVEGYEEEAAGGISIKIHSPYVNDFDEHYLSLKPSNNTWNPWFREFWQEKFHCHLEGADRDRRYNTSCTEDEDLSDNYVQDAKLGFVINAIYTMAYALHSMHGEVCKGIPGPCPGLLPIDGDLFLKHLTKVSYSTYANQPLMFDKNGDPPGRYDIMNFQPVNKTRNHRYEYKKVGSWNNGALNINSKLIYWPSEGGIGSQDIVTSVCSAPCLFGQVKKVQKGEGLKCCWICTKCQENEIVFDEKTCKPCSKGYWPNIALSECHPIPIEYPKWGDAGTIVVIVISCLGTIITSISLIVFIIYRETPVVKATTRELSYIILSGIIVTYFISLIIIMKPAAWNCYLSRILPGISFSMIYGALVTKTNRISRILARSKKKIMTTKPRFMTATAQVVITLILVGTECIITVGVLVYEPSDAILFYPSSKRVQLICNTSSLAIVAHLGFDLVLICMCTIYAVKTRSVPSNFNEAKFIGFTMYTTCVIWVAFVPLYFGTDSKVITMCISISLSSTVALALLYIPKVYIILFKPERNTRSSFTTAKDVRCHIGTTQSDKKPTISNISMQMNGPRNAFRKWKEKGVKPEKPASVGSSPSNTPREQRDSIHIPKDSSMSGSAGLDISQSDSKVPEWKRQLVEQEVREFRTLSSIEESHLERETSCKSKKGSIKSKKGSIKIKRLESVESQTDTYLLDTYLTSLRRQTFATRCAHETSGQINPMTNNGNLLPNNDLLDDNKTPTSSRDDKLDDDLDHSEYSPLLPDTSEVEPISAQPNISEKPKTSENRQTKAAHGCSDLTPLLSLYSGDSLSSNTDTPNQCQSICDNQLTPDSITTLASDIQTDLDRKSSIKYNKSNNGQLVYYNELSPDLSPNEPSISLITDNQDESLQEEGDSIDQFLSYLHTTGTVLDLDSIQSSDV